MRLRSTALLSAFLFTAGLLAGCGSDTGDAAATASADIPATLPATVEGVVFFDLGESELEVSDLKAGMTTDIGFDTGGDDGMVMLRVPGDLLKATGVTGEGERVRATLSGKSQESGIDYYTVTAFERI
jgi:hypothetical protein